MFQLCYYGVQLTIYCSVFFDNLSIEVSLFLYVLYLVSAANVLHDRNILYSRFFFLHAFFSPLVSHGLFA